MGYGINPIQELYEDCIRTQVVTDAIELLQDGYPLDDKTMKALGEIGVDYAEFIRRFEIKTDI